MKQVVASLGERSPARDVVPNPTLILTSTTHLRKPMNYQNKPVFFSSPLVCSHFQLTSPVAQKIATSSKTIRPTTDKQRHTVQHKHTEETNTHLTARLIRTHASSVAAEETCEYAAILTAKSDQWAKMFVLKLLTEKSDVYQFSHTPASSCSCNLLPTH